MGDDAGSTEIPLALASTTVGPGLPATEPPVALPHIGGPGDRRLGRLTRLPLLRWVGGTRSAAIGIAALILGTFAIVAFAVGAPSILVPRSNQVFPNWEAGPLHDVIPRLFTSSNHLGVAFSALLVIMALAYLVVLAAVRSVSMRTIAIAVVALHVILLMSPPMQLTDLFNYVGYARLGALHHLNPYNHVIHQELFDPVSGFASWHNLSSPYGPLFSALTYPLAFVSLPIAYWVVKIATIAMSLAFIALIWHCARRLGRDPRYAVALVAFNPVFLIYAVGGFHNDFFMLVPMLGAIAFMLDRRDRASGATLMLAVAVKFTAVVLLPFLLVAAHTRSRRVRVLTGCALGAIPLVVLSLALFGFSIPNLSQQSSVLTGTSIVNVVGLLLHVGGATPLLLKIAAVGVVLVVAHQFYRNSDWLAGAGWSTMALIASLGWLMPWYVVWALPLAALGSSVRLRRLSIVLSIYLLLAFIPWTGKYMSSHGINLLNTRAGNAAASLQYKLEQ
ncbi:MAG TPA: glycosyltransferase 87 family protein [Solirubrobacteraceae bacterium]|jgi:hypothetical protein|nr:glycosyltransferase 87 family protein [Solirubrobacteraceae bacterium]